MMHCIRWARVARSGRKTYLSSNTILQLDAVRIVILQEQVPTCGFLDPVLSLNWRAITLYNASNWLSLLRFRPFSRYRLSILI